MWLFTHLLSLLYKIACIFTPIYQKYLNVSFFLKSVQAFSNTNMVKRNKKSAAGWSPWPPRKITRRVHKQMVEEMKGKLTICIIISSVWQSSRRVGGLFCLKKKDRRLKQTFLCPKLILTWRQKSTWMSLCLPTTPRTKKDRT